MAFIGIIADNRSENRILNYLNNNFHEKNIKGNIIFIKNKNINNIKNIKFDTLLINKKISSKNDIVKKIVLNSKNLIVNSDIDTGLSCINSSLINVITYGFNSKSTVTASSIETDTALICIQKNIKNVNNIVLEPQEFKVEKINKSNNPYIIMGVETLTLLHVP